MSGLDLMGQQQQGNRRTRPAPQLRRRAWNFSPSSLPQFWCPAPSTLFARMNYARLLDAREIKAERSQLLARSGSCDSEGYIRTCARTKVVILFMAVSDLPTYWHQRNSKNRSTHKKALVRHEQVSLAEPNSQPFLRNYMLRIF
jgi:hypothetical protein